VTAAPGAVATVTGADAAVAAGAVRDSCKSQPKLFFRFYAIVNYDRIEHRSQEILYRHRFGTLSA